MLCQGETKGQQIHHGMSWCPCYGFNRVPFQCFLSFSLDSYSDHSLASCSPLFAMCLVKGAGWLLNVFFFLFENVLNLFENTKNKINQFDIFFYYTKHAEMQHQTAY